MRVIVIHGQNLAKLSFDGSEICGEMCGGGVVWYIFTRNITSGNVSYMYSE